MVTQVEAIDLFYAMGKGSYKRPKKKEPPPVDKDAELKKLAVRLKELRKKAGFTSYETFANEYGPHRAQYGRYERGANLQYTSLLTVLRALDISLKDFFSEGFD